jgi:hypothetical protein
VLVLGGSSALLLLEDALAVLVELEGGDGAVAGVDGDLSLLTVGLLLYDFLNVNASASTVDGLDLAFTTLLGASHDLNLITLADGHGTHAVLVLKVLGEMSAHHDSADAAGSGEVGLS